MIADLHAHYPMHLDPGIRGNPWRLLRTRAGRLRLRDYVRALGVNLASQFANYPGLFSGERVNVPYMVEGRVGVACSVLYSFFDEADKAPSDPAEYTDELLRQADLVERSLHGTPAVIARTPAELQPQEGRVVLVHCVEGGFHLLGGDVGHAVDRLADRGIAYITLAHLIYRGVATSANAFPFLSDGQYEKRCRQPPIGLTSAGRAAVEAMVRRRVLIDVSHMSERSLDDVFGLLDELDPDKRVPVIASHGGWRFGSQRYQLSRPTVERIVARDGVIGLILAEHQLRDGLEDVAEQDFDGAFEVLARHIEAIHEVTHDYRHVAIGSDFDGFIKPTLKGLRDMRDMRRLEERLRERFGDADAQLMCADNVLRPLRGYWAGAPIP